MNLVENLRDCADAALVGGKAAHLGTLLRAGFDVPDGFVIAPAANGSAAGLIREAYQKLTAPMVAVRSSATVEDGPDASMAGQFKTILNVGSEAELIEAIELCRASGQDSRVAAYLGAQDRPPKRIEMAVIVQRQIAPEAAGVLFTSSPLRPDEMLIEAGPGLGEAVVSGRQQPDSFRIKADTAEIIETRVTSSTPCLTQETVRKLWALGRAVVACFGTPQDIEWAVAGDRLFLLQARPITARSGVVDEPAWLEDARKALAQSGRGPWVRHNLAETLPHPTPLTWSLMRRFMSGAGGLGLAYAKLGFEPAAGEILDLILGQVYLDLAHAPEIFGAGFPFAYDAAALRHDPCVAEVAPTVPRGSWLSRHRARRRMAAAQAHLERASGDLDRRLTERIIPEFVAWCAREKKRDLAALPADAWIALWHDRENRIFHQFAPELLFTNFIAASACAQLREFLAEHFWDDEPGALAQLLLSAGAPTRTLVADAELREVAEGQRPIETWLAEHGHRAIGEFDLAAPRWRELPRELAAYAARLKNGKDPLARQRERAGRAAERIASIAPGAARQLRAKLDLARRYLAFREDGKDHFMLGYELLRAMTLEAARRLRMDVFWLTSDELCAALHGQPVNRELLEQRQREHRAGARMTLPQFIDQATLGTLGAAPELHGHDYFRGLAISSGTASGALRIVRSPLEAPDLGRGYVLCCPSTDPAWTPLFVNAAALILECGGALSHGAIVARELNIPAIVLPDAMRLLREGEIVFVDGSSGVVAGQALPPGPDANDIRVAPELVPPVAGERARRGARWRNRGFIFWSLYLLAAWGLPARWLEQPTMHAFDWLLWPLVRAWEKPATVALVGAALALLAAVAQAVFADNTRLREASRRARVLRAAAASLPPDSTRRRALLGIAASVQRRIAGASLVPVGLLLGLFVMSFSWLTLRMNETNPAPGTSARVVASVDADFREPITLAIQPPLRLDESSHLTRSLPPIRETLERLPLQTALPEAAQADLRCYLRRGVPPQKLVWIVRCDQPGSFSVALIPGKMPAVRGAVVFGEDRPPPDIQKTRTQGSPIRSLQVENTAPRSPFWTLRSVAPPFGHDIDWLTVYLATYVPTWLLLRRLLALV